MEDTNKLRLTLFFRSGNTVVVTIEDDGHPIEYWSDELRATIDNDEYMVLHDVSDEWHVARADMIEHFSIARVRLLTAEDWAEMEAEVLA